MTKFLIELWLDDYSDEAEMIEACKEFIVDSLDFASSSVKVLAVVPDDVNFRDGQFRQTP